LRGGNPQKRLGLSTIPSAIRNDSRAQRFLFAPLSRSIEPVINAHDPLPAGLAGVAERLRRGPRLHPSAFVVPTATVVGDVTLHEEASVWYGAVLRGDINRIVVGARSNIQDCAVVHLSDDFGVAIGELVTIGHSAVVHACTVEDEVLVGMGAIILDGAEIGARSIIGANTLVTAGMKVPPGSLVVGSPGKVVRVLAADEQANIKTWALKYVQNAKLFRDHYSRSASES
jgi:carbonic anhydrase/acetyltransferase-like protein (isoleucine patch superfamily)